MKHPSPRRWIALALVGALTSCGGGSPLQGSGPAPSPATASLAQQIEALESSGQLPRLDRSTDLRGPDRDDNGIRDDIDAWIAALPLTESQTKAAQQASKVMQREVLADTADRAELQRLGDASMAAIKCLGDRFAPHHQDGLDLSAEIEAITANTKQRAWQYLAYNRAVSGSSGRLPEGDTCEP